MKTLVDAKGKSEELQVINGEFWIPVVLWMRLEATGSRESDISQTYWDKYGLNRKIILSVPSSLKHSIFSSCIEMWNTGASKSRHQKLFTSNQHSTNNAHSHILALRNAEYDFLYLFKVCSSLAVSTLCDPSNTEMNQFLWLYFCDEITTLLPSYWVFRRSGRNDRTPFVFLTRLHRTGWVSVQVMWPCDLPSKRHESKVNSFFACMNVLLF